MNKTEEFILLYIVQYQRFIPLNKRQSDAAERMRKAGILGRHNWSVDASRFVYYFPQPLLQHDKSMGLR